MEPYWKDMLNQPQDNWGLVHKKQLQDDEFEDRFQGYDLSQSSGTSLGGALDSLSQSSGTSLGGALDSLSQSSGTGNDSQSSHYESPTPAQGSRTKKNKDSVVKQQKGIDYKKNIYAYISKMIVKFFVGEKLKEKILGLCKRVGCSYNDAAAFYKRKKKQVFGVGHLSEMLIPNDEEEAKIKKVFYLFLTWFLRQKYMAYMVMQGKMEDKEIYISYKNKLFLHIDQEIRKYY